MPQTINQNHCNILGLFSGNLLGSFLAIDGTYSINELSSMGGGGGLFNILCSDFIVTLQFRYKVVNSVNRISDIHGCLLFISALSPNSNGWLLSISFCWMDTEHFTVHGHIMYITLHVSRSQTLFKAKLACTMKMLFLTQGTMIQMYMQTKLWYMFCSKSQIDWEEMGELTQIIIIKRTNTHLHTKSHNSYSATE